MTAAEQKKKADVRLREDEDDVIVSRSERTFCFFVCCVCVGVRVWRERNAVAAASKEKKLGVKKKTRRFPIFPALVPHEMHVMRRRHIS